MTAHSQQLPDRGEVFLDHVGWMIPHMEKTGDAFSRLGFVLTPYSEHSNKNATTGEITRQGSANRLIMLETGYLELLTDVADIQSSVAQNLRASMKRYIGLHLVAFSTADVEAETGRLTDAGFDLQPTVNLRRTIEAADGSEVEVAFSVIRPRFGSIAEGRIQSLTHHTPEHMWQQRYQKHINAIVALSGIVMCSNDPQASAKRLSLYTNRSAYPLPYGCGISTDRGKIIFTGKDTLSEQFGGLEAPDLPSIPALMFTSSSLEETRTYFHNQNIQLLADQPDRLIVHPDDAMGCALIIT